MQKGRPMKGLDTNLLVRYFTQDHARQSRQAGELIENHCTPENPGFIAAIVMCELVWVLSAGYGYKRNDIARLLRGILSTPSFVVESHNLMASALSMYEKGEAGFSDYLIAMTCKEHEALPVYTFDNAAIKSGDLFTAVP